MGWNFRLLPENSLLFHKGNFMHELLIANRFDFHKHTVGFSATFILANGKRLPAFGRSLVDDIEFAGRMLLKEIAEYKFSLRFAVRFYFVIDGYVNRLVQVFGKFFRAASFDGFFHLADHVTILCQYGHSL